MRTVLILSLVLAAQIAKASTAALPRKIVFSRSVPSYQAEQLNADIERKISFADDLPDLKDLLGIQEYSLSALSDWLSERVGWIVGEKEDTEGRLSEMGAHVYQ